MPTTYEQVNEAREVQFNEGIRKLGRIGRLREGCHEARLKKDLDLWFTSVKGMRSEMNSKFTKKPVKDKTLSERDQCTEYEKAIKLYLDNKKSVEIKLNGFMGKVGQIDIFDLLYDYELFLGDLEEKYKFGMPDKESPSFALK